MEKIKSLAREKEHKYLMLKWAGEQDVKEYLAGRDSLAFRNSEGRCCCEMDKKRFNRNFNRLAERGCYKHLVGFVVKSMFLTNRKLHLTPLHSSFLIFHPLLGHNDVENYKKECAEKDRASLFFRRT